MDAGGWSACTSPANYTGLAEGIHTFQVRATDAALNTDPTPASYSWEIDRTAPDTLITANPPDPAYSSTADFSFTCDDPPCTFDCRIDAGAWSACTSPKQYTGLSAGSHTFYVRAYDAALNLDATPATYTWTIQTNFATISTVNAPSNRYKHCAVWSGTMMLIWGGNTSPGTLTNTGARYDPATDTWTTISTGANVPVARTDHTCVWGLDVISYFIVWGGWDGTQLLNSGGRYDPLTDSWKTISTSGAPTPRRYHSAIWNLNASSEMIIWGGRDATGVVNTGGQYNAGPDVWSATKTGPGVPSPREFHAAVFALGPKKMIVWGGRDATSTYLNNGAYYDPAPGKWTTMSTVNAPTARAFHSGVLDGNTITIWWGGYNGTSHLNSGGIYNVTTNTWTVMSTTNAPSGRRYHAAAFVSGTINRMIIWGGYDGTTVLGDGGQYSRATNTWTPIGTGGPAPRYWHSGIGTTTNMIIFGGYDGTTVFGDGWKFTP